MTTVAEVRLWGSRIGAVSLQDGADVAAFAYDPAFIASGIQVAPLMMPLGPEVYTFPDLNPRSFHGLPGMLADALPAGHVFNVERKVGIDGCGSGFRVMLVSGAHRRFSVIGNS